VSKLAIVAGLAFVLLMLLPATMRAQIIPHGNVYVGGSYSSSEIVTADRTGLKGWNGGAEAIVLPHVGIVADLSGYYGDGGLTQYNFLLGPRVSVNVGKWRPFAEALFGLGRENDGGFHQNSFASGFGGGADYKFLKVFAWRVEADYIHTSYFSAKQNDIKASTGIVFRF